MPNSIMACLLDPRYTLSLCKIYSKARIELVVERIIEETSLLYAEGTREMAKGALRATAKSMLKALKISGLSPRDSPSTALDW